MSVAQQNTIIVIVSGRTKFRVEVGVGVASAHRVVPTRIGSAHFSASTGNVKRTLGTNYANSNML